MRGTRLPRRVPEPISLLRTVAAADEGPASTAGQLESGQLSAVLIASSPTKPNQSSRPTDRGDSRSIAHPHQTSSASSAASSAPAEAATLLPGQTAPPRLPAPSAHRTALPCPQVPPPETPHLVPSRTPAAR